jgi:dTMP kinase
MQTGKFIVLEGIDGSGTTTQATELIKWLISKGIPAISTQEPTDGPIGKLIRQFLSGEIQVGYRKQSVLLSLFAADRAMHSESIEANIRNGTWVISDRYLASSMAYQSLDSRFDPAIIYQHNVDIYPADLTILLDVPACLAMTRIKNRNEKPEIFENLDFLLKTEKCYQELTENYTRGQYPNLGFLKVVDGQKSIIEVTEELKVSILNSFPKDLKP